MSKKSKTIQASGKRKTSVARATLSDGNGMVRVNSIALDQYQPEISKMKIMEPLILAGDKASKVNIKVSVNGGGIISQAESVRLAIARTLVEKYGDAMKKVFLDYDRTLLVADTRRKEPAKPNSQGNARAKRQKSYR